MKKILSVFLSVLILITTTAPASAEAVKYSNTELSANQSENGSVHFWDICDYNRMALSASQICVSLANSYSSQNLLWLTSLQLIQSGGTELGLTEILARFNLCTGFDDKQIDAVTDAFLQTYLKYYDPESANSQTSKVSAFLTKINEKLESVDDWENITMGELLAYYGLCQADADFAEFMIELLIEEDELISKSIEYGINLTKFVCNITNVIICDKMLIENLMDCVDKNSLLYYGLQRRFERDFINETKDFIAKISTSTIVDIVKDALLSSTKGIVLDAAISMMKIAIQVTNTPVAEDVIRAQYSLSMAMSLRNSLSELQNQDSFELLFNAYNASMVTTYNYFAKLREKSTAEDDNFAFDVYQKWLTTYAGSSYSDYTSQKLSFESGTIHPKPTIKYELKSSPVVIYPDGFKLGNHRKITYFANYSVATSCQSIVLAPTESGKNTIWSDISFSGNSNFNSVNLYYQGDMILESMAAINQVKLVIAGNEDGTDNGSLVIKGNIDLKGRLMISENSNVNLEGVVNGIGYGGMMWAASNSTITNMGRLEINSMKNSIRFEQVDNPDAELIVNGNLTLPWSNTPSPYDIVISTGTAKIIGNVAALKAEKGAKLYFCGGYGQEVDFIESYDAELANPYGLTIKSTYDLKGNFSGNGYPITGSLTLYPSAYVDENTYCTTFILYQNSEYSSTYPINRSITFNGNVTGQNIKISEGNRLTVNGNCKSNVDNYGEYVLNGNQNKSMTNYGTAVINGDITYGPINNYGILDVNGNISLSNSNNRLDCYGGAIYTSGNIYAGNIYCRDDSSIIFDGNTTQFVGVMYSDEYTVFQILEITNTSPQGVIFKRTLDVRTLFNHNRNKFTLKMPSKFADYDGDGIKDNADPYPTVKSGGIPEFTEELTAEYSDMLNSITLPDGWVWQDKSETVEFGENYYTALFKTTDDDVFDYSVFPNYDPISHSVSVSLKVTGVSKRITPTVSIKEACVFDGSEQEPDFEVSFNGEVLSPDCYQFKYHNNINAGEGTAFITVSSVKDCKYSFAHVSENFSIKKAIFSEENTIFDSFGLDESGKHSIYIYGLPANTGDILGGTAQVISDNDDIIEDKVTFDNGKVTYFVNDISENKAGKTACVEISVNTLNYEPVSILLVLTANKKNTQKTPSCSLTLEIQSDNTYTATIAAIDGAEYKFNNGCWSTQNTLSNIPHSAVVTAQIRMSETEVFNPSEPVTASLISGHGKLTHIEPAEPTCTDIGHCEYWYCEKCGKYFSDDAEITETTREMLVIASMGHSWSKAFISDGKGHCHECVNCDAVSKTESHIPGEEATISSPQICTVCSYELTPSIGTVSAPEISSRAGKYGDLKDVTISCATPGAVIYYTVDGSEPTSESTRYESAFTLCKTATVKAIAIKTGMKNSKSVSAGFIVSQSPVTEKAHNLILGDDIGVVFSLEFADYVLTNDTAKLVFDVNGKITEIPINRSNPNEYGYQFTCPVAAAEMTDVINGQLYLDGEPIGEKFSYSIKTYASYILHNADRFANEIPLVIAMLNYGSQAQLIFNHNTENLANSILNENETVLTTISADELKTYKCEISDNDDNINFLGQVIGLKNKAAAKFYFSGDITLDMCTVNDKQIPAEDLCNDENGTYIVIRDISPDNYDRPFKITVGNVTINNASVFSYLYSALNGKRTELYDIVYAVYAFNKAAETYSAQLSLNSVE